MSRMVVPYALSNHAINRRRAKAVNDFFKFKRAWVLRTGLQLRRTANRTKKRERVKNKESREQKNEKDSLRTAGVIS